MKLKLLTIPLAILISYGIANAAMDKSCPSVGEDNHAMSLKFFNKLKGPNNDFTGESHHFKLSAEGRELLKKQPLPARLGILGGIINADKSNKVGHRLACCYRYAFKRRDINKAPDCNTNRTCFCVYKDDKATGGTNAQEAHRGGVVGGTATLHSGTNALAGKAGAYRQQEQK